MTKSLNGLKVVEIGGPPGAFAGMMLADHGADVLKISRAGGGGSVGAGGGASSHPLGRGRRSVDVDLRSLGPPERFLMLVERADVLIEGHRPGVMERLGVGPSQRLAGSPALVFARMTGWQRLPAVRHVRVETSCYRHACPPLAGHALMPTRVTSAARSAVDQSAGDDLTPPIGVELFQGALEVAALLQRPSKHREAGK